MRKFAIATVLLVSASMPGCIFAYGTDNWDEGESDCCSGCVQMTHAEKRLSVIEHHLKGDCKPECSLCKHAEKSEAKSEKAEAEKAAKAEKAEAKAPAAK